MVSRQLYWPLIIKSGGLGVEIEALISNLDTRPGILNEVINMDSRAWLINPFQKRAKCYF